MKKKIGKCKRCGRLWRPGPGVPPSSKPPCPLGVKCEAGQMCGANRKGYFCRLPIHDRDGTPHVSPEFKWSDE